ncbi:MAG: hypothetical protein QW594_03260, partial [Candidatus Woesearchaeota archaeon]
MDSGAGSNNRLELKTLVPKLIPLVRNTQAPKPNFLVFVLLALVFALFCTVFAHASITTAHLYGTDKISGLYDLHNPQEAVSIEALVVDPQGIDINQLSLSLQSYGVTFPLSSCNVICTPLTGVQYQQGTHNCTCNLQWKPTQAQLLTLR